MAPTLNTSLRRLIWTARTRHDGRAKASGGRWTARTEGGEIIVRHFTTDMFAVAAQGDDVRPISRGWGSMTDKCGTGRILSGAGIWASYFTLFG